MSGVRVGDRVRLTCGESVIVGTATMVDADLSVDVDGDGPRVFLTDLWAVEVLLPPVGTVVLDRNNFAWQSTRQGWKQVGFRERYSLAYIDIYYGPLVVLWTPSGELTGE